LRRSRHRIVVTALLLAVATVAMGCGGNKKEEGSSSSGGGGDLSTSKISNGDTDAKPKTGGTLTFALEAENSGGWCLVESQLAASGIQVMNAVYDPLMAFDADFKPQPYLAQSVESNPEHTLFTIKLRPDIKFHDGTPLTSKVVKLNLDLWKGDPTALAETGRKPLLLPIVFKDMGDVTIVDDLTLTVATKRPWAAFLDYLAMGRSGIAAEAQLRSSPDDCKQKLIGTGPFKIVKWDRNVELDLEKNPDYWMKDKDGVQLPYLDKLIFKPIPSGPDRLTALQGGAIDAMHTTLVDNFKQVASEPDKFNMSSDTEGHREVGYGLINVSKAPFDNLEIRKALGQALDRDRLNKISNDGAFTIANGPFDSAVMGYLPDLKGPKYDPEAARAALEGKNISFNLTYVTDPNTKKLAEEVQREMGQVGVKVDIAELDQATTITKAIGGDFNLLLWRNHPGTDPDTQYLWFYSDSPVNFSKIKDPELDKLWDEGRTTTDQTARKAIYEQINQRMSDMAYEAWNWYSEWRYATTKDVKNFSNYMLPDDNNVANIKGAGMNWGWSYLAGVWKDS